QPKPAEQPKPDYSKVFTITGKLDALNEKDVDKFNWRHYGIEDNTGTVWVDIEKMSDGNKQGVFSGNVGNYHYLFANQVYSSYGVIGGSSFVHEGASTTFGNVSNHKEHYVIGSINNGVKEIDPKLHGSATYKGVVITGDSGFFGPTHTVDGNVTLNAHFAKTLDKSTISGEINSNKMGKITLVETDMTRNQDYFNHEKLGLGKIDAIEVDKTERKTDNYLGFEGKAVLNGREGAYRGTFHGPLLNEVVGGVTFGGRDYSAVFGATKEAK
ncbi:hypothetical protein ACWIW6_10900, partial [Ursidibacter sp. B-7004-1]